MNILIPHELGKQAISFGIDKYPETLYPKFNKKFIIDGIELLQNNNSFQFNNVNYIQIQRTAMGTKMAPTYATLTLAYLEENLYKIIGKKYSNNIKKYGNNIKGEFTKSYSDDYFIFWKCPWGNVNELNNLFQNLHPKIKFTMEHSFKELPLLDIPIKKQKWPNCHRYLPQTHRHPTIPPLQ